MESKLKSLVRELMKEIEQEEMELDEMSVTANVAGYNTPNAFKKTDGTDEDETTDDSFVDRINTSTGYTRVNENRWVALKREESSPNQKIGKGISTIKNQLSEIETFLNWYSKIKNESGLSRDAYWKRTHRNLQSIRERLMNISEKIRGL